MSVIYLSDYKSRQKDSVESIRFEIIDRELREFSALVLNKWKESNDILEQEG